MQRDYKVASKQHKQNFERIKIATSTLPTTRNDLKKFRCVFAPFSSRPSRASAVRPKNIVHQVQVSQQNLFWIENSVVVHDLRWWVLIFQLGRQVNLVWKVIAVTLACRARPAEKDRSDQEDQKGKQIRFELRQSLNFMR